MKNILSFEDWVVLNEQGFSIESMDELMNVFDIKTPEEAIEIINEILVFEINDAIEHEE